jgi:hypothetical protein
MPPQSVSLSLPLFCAHGSHVGKRRSVQQNAAMSDSSDLMSAEKTRQIDSKMEMIEIQNSVTSLTSQLSLLRFRLNWT